MEDKKKDVKIRAYKFSLEIIKCIEGLAKKRSSRIIADQLIRSSTSVGANIIEAKSSSSKKEFVHYFEIALKSANETRYWLGLLRDSGLMEKTQADLLLAEAKEISNIIGASVLTLKNKK